MNYSIDFNRIRLGVSFLKEGWSWGMMAAYGFNIRELELIQDHSRFS